LHPQGGRSARRLRLQNAFAKLERTCSARLYLLFADMRQCRQERAATIAAAAQARATAFGRAALPAFCCYATWAFTTRAASAASRLAGRQAELEKTARHVADERRHWLRCRLGLERRMLRGAQPT